MGGSLKIKIVNTKHNDSLIVEEPTIEEARISAKNEWKKRGWKESDMYSETIAG